ncbi:hypothetical protein PLICRDRAFT_566489 [Plicaturopsis crispa FD-325 SS-3]|nr:hypothetical protein PLICRDRAFT_566489 [Plicaturopsis crispa FD-325 SS-3]
MASIPNHFPFHDLPDELVLSVFNLAAASSRQTCLSLTLVASWTRTLALPHLFSTVVLTSHTASRTFARALDHDDGGERALLVRNLCDVSGDISGLHIQLLDQLLTRCVNATNIAVSSGAFLRVTLQYRFMEYTKSPSSSLPTRPEELTIVTPGPDDRDFHAFHDFQEWMSATLYRGSGSPLPRMLDCVTRLDVSRAYEPTTTISRSVRLFRQLTHLKVLFKYSDEKAPDERRSVRACLSDTLVQLVLAPKDESVLADAEFTEWFVEARREDGRLCISRVRATAVGWEDITRRQVSVWDMAIRETQEWESAALG